MPGRSDRDTRPFGRRGAGPAPPDPTWDEPARGPGPLAWALRTAGVVLVLALAATQYLARVSAPAGGAGPALLARGPQSDPETTGSIGGAARATRLDPCALAAGGRRP